MCRLAVQVSDTGIGLDADQCQALFCDFNQPHQAAGQHGTGLGLSISRSVARALGGDVTVESSPGVGSTFTVWVPMAHGA